jgi:hypothetical protein
MGLSHDSLLQGCGGQALVGVSSTAGGRLLTMPAYCILLVVDGKGVSMVSKDKGKQIQVTSYYEPAQIEQLRRLSGSTRVPQAVYIREALDDLLKKYATTLRKAAK